VLPGGPFVIEAARATPSSVYVGAAMLDGSTVGQRVSYADVAAGGTLHLDLSDSH